jgi:Zn-finger nucleic acid-binding protein
MNTLICPRTGTPLKEVEFGGVKVDLSEACGGVWLDNYELAKFDEVHEGAGTDLCALMEVHGKDVHIDKSKRIHCPRDGMILQRHFFSSLREIEIDECPQCGGIWLDAGELARIRDLFPTEADRQVSGAAFAQAMFESSGFQEDAAKTEALQRKAARFANLFRWIRPRR